MRIREVQARTILMTVHQPDTWFGMRYNMNLYRGCQHQCIYCDSRSECYQIEDFNGEVLVKVNAPELLAKELAHKRIPGTIGTGSMNDPYMPLEAERRLTGRALEIIASFGFPVHVITKSDLVLRDLPVLTAISKTYAAISMTITVADDDLCKKIEPGAPVTSQRFQAIEKLAAAGVYTGVTLMPVLPFITDNVENICAIVARAAAAGAGYILPAFSVTLRNRQRAYYYQQLQRLYPGLTEVYQRAYGESYSCKPANVKELYSAFQEACDKRGMATQMRFYAPARLF